MHISSPFFRHRFSPTLIYYSPLIKCSIYQLAKQKRNMHRTAAGTVLKSKVTHVVQ